MIKSLPNDNADESYSHNDESGNVQDFDKKFLLSGLTSFVRGTNNF